jgi:hypothetical protein
MWRHRVSQKAELSAGALDVEEDSIPHVGKLVSLQFVEIGACERALVTFMHAFDITLCVPANKPRKPTESCGVQTVSH